MTHAPGDREPYKRKRIDEGDNSGGGGPGGGGGGGVPMRLGGFPQMASHPQHFGTASATSINYLSRSNYEKLRLIQGDGDVLGSLLQLLAEYEGVLSRQESFAANLGGKLTAPRLIKAVEGAFEGPILTSPPQSPHSPLSVRWPDIIQYARASPGGFTTGHLPGGGRVCQFHLKGVRVEVMEDDWRIIATGALDGMIPEAPLEEDEAAELATAEILEARLETIARGAEEVARRAKGLAFALSGRRRGILGRRESLRGNQGFQAVNSEAGGSSYAAGRKRRNSGMGALGSWGARGETGGDLHADLLQQFNTAPPSPRSIPRPIYTAAGAGLHMGLHAVGPAPSQGPRVGDTAYPVVSPTGRYPPIAPSGRLPAPLPTARRDVAADDGDSPYRPLIMSMVETLGKGDEISPACDRCRRLRVDCVKHLTACQGCTRKHAKCTWKTATEAEIVASRARREDRRRAVEGAAGLSLAVELAAAGGVAKVSAAGGGMRAEADDGGSGVKREEKREGARMSGGEETTPMSRMDIDSITTQHEGSSAKPSPTATTTATATTTGLPRDRNFLGSPTDGESGRSLTSTASIQPGQQP